MRSTPSDINEHLDVLRDLASECETVIEFGTRLGVSAVALIEGKPKTFTTCDVCKESSAEKMLAEFAASLGVAFSFLSADDRQIEIPPTDMLFIDTQHMYAQLKEELRLHANKVKKYLVFHDTTAFANSGDLDPHDKGLWPAIEEFLAEHPEWTIMKRYTHNNGLTVLRRS